MRKLTITNIQKLIGEEVYVPVQSKVNSNLMAIWKVSEAAPMVDIHLLYTIKVVHGPTGNTSSVTIDIRRDFIGIGENRVIVRSNHSSNGGIYSKSYSIEDMKTIHDMKNLLVKIIDTAPHGSIK
jgi:hypothetical protein